MTLSPSRPARIRRTALAILAIAAGLTACGTTTDPVGPTVPPGAESPEISDEAATQLCDMLRAEIGNWQQQGPAVARVSYNGTVHNWALRNGAVNAAVTRNREAIDTTAVAHCPDVRDQVLATLEIDDLASGLLGF